MKQSSKETFWKWSSVIGCCLQMATCGFPFYWGNLTVYTKSYIWNQGHSESAVMTPWVLPLWLSGMALGALFGGAVAPYTGRYLMLLMGTIIQCVGISVVSVVINTDESMILFSFCLGLVQGFSSGISIVMTTCIVIDWADNRAGLFMSIIRVFMLLGAIVTSQTATSLINPDDESTQIEVHSLKFFNQPDIVDKVPDTFWIIGVVYLVIGVLGVIMIRERSSVTKEGKPRVFSYFSMISRAKARYKSYSDLNKKPSSHLLQQQQNYNSLEHENHQQGEQGDEQQEHNHHEQNHEQDHEQIEKQRHGGEEEEMRDIIRERRRKQQLRKQQQLREHQEQQRQRLELREKLELRRQKEQRLVQQQQRQQQQQQVELEHHDDDNLEQQQEKHHPVQEEDKEGEEQKQQRYEEQQIQQQQQQIQLQPLPQQQQQNHHQQPHHQPQHHQQQHSEEEHHHHHHNNLPHRHHRQDRHHQRHQQQTQEIPQDTETPSSPNLSPKQVLKSCQFYALFATLALCSIPFVAINNYGKSYGQLHYQSDLFLTALNNAVLGVSIIIFLISGVFLDKTTNKIILIIYCTTLSLVSLLFYFSPMIATWLFCVTYVLFCCTSSITMVIFPLVTARAFGKTHVAMNYAMVMIAFVPVNLIVPQLMDYLLNHTGWFSIFALSSVASVISLLLVVLVLKK